MPARHAVLSLAGLSVGISLALVASVAVPVLLEISMVKPEASLGCQAFDVQVISPSLAWFWLWKARHVWVSFIWIVGGFVSSVRTWGCFTCFSVNSISQVHARSGRGALDVADCLCNQPFFFRESMDAHVGLVRRQCMPKINTLHPLRVQDLADFDWNELQYCLSKLSNLFIRVLAM